MIESDVLLAIIHVVGRALRLVDDELEAFALVRERVFLIEDQIEAERRQKDAVELLGHAKGIGADREVMDRVNWHALCCLSPYERSAQRSNEIERPPIRPSYDAANSQSLARFTQ